MMAEGHGNQCSEENSLHKATSGLLDSKSCSEVLANGEESVRSASFGLGLCWTQDFVSLKRFVSESLNLDGVWSSPGGDKKVFSIGHSSISWRKNNKVLNFYGDDVDDLRRKFCQIMCGFTNNENVKREKAPVIDLDGEFHGSCRCSEIIPDVEGLKLDIVVAEKVIQSNSDAIDMVKYELKKIHDKQNDIQRHIENSKREVAEALHSPFEYANRIRLNFDTIDTVKHELKKIHDKQNDIQQQIQNSKREVTEALHSPPEYSDPDCDIVLERKNISPDKPIIIEEIASHNAMNSKDDAPPKCVIATHSTAWQLDEYRKKHRNTFKGQTTTHGYNLGQPNQNSYNGDFPRSRVTGNRATRQQQPRSANQSTHSRKFTRSLLVSTEYSRGYHINKSKDRKQRMNNQEFFRVQTNCQKDEWLDYLKLVRRTMRQRR